MIQEFTQWLSQTHPNAVFSDTTHLSTWLIIPVSQCIHIVSVAIVMISVGVLNLNLLGIAGTRQSFAQLAKHLIPWIWGALIVLFITGTVQTIAEPSRELLNITFRVKMAMLLMAVAITLIYQITLKKDPHFWELSPQRRQTSRLLATMSLVLWVGIAAAGRLIAYIDIRQDF
jgi:hypothetical protein